MLIYLLHLVGETLDLIKMIIIYRNNDHFSILEYFKLHGFRMQKQKLAEEYRDILLNSKLITFDISAEIFEQAAGLRAEYNLRTPDAIQISTALKAGATLFFTNDIRLPEIPSIKILLLDSAS